VGFRHWRGITAILGLFFVAGIVIAWRQLLAVGVGIATNPSSSFFYVFTAAHAFHVLGGVAALAAVAFRPLRRLSRATAAEVVSIYWHTINGLWVLLVLFLLIEK
jgi:cytochrome c oxidase subunit 3